MPSFQEVLNVPVGKLEKSKPLPPGSYLCVVSDMPKHTTVGNDKLDVVDFRLKPLQPMQDVNQSELVDAGGLQDKSLRLRQFVNTDNGQYYLGQFLMKTLKLDVEGKPLKEALAMCQGKQLVAHVNHRIFTNSSGQPEIANEIDTTAPI